MMNNLPAHLNAIKLIPGGTGLFGKREQLYCPGIWPTHYKRASKLYIWDMNGRKYIDCTMVGIGTSVLGYANRRVNRAVKTAIDNGSMSSLNCFEECILAEVLIDLHPWADMVRYTRTGGEAMSVAIRCARAATGRDLVAYNGYHGWHDWYLSSGRHDKTGLYNALFSNVPVAGTSFHKQSIYVDTTNLESVNHYFETYGDSTSAFVVELVRDSAILDSTLLTISSECRRRGICLIFDEITSGFRTTLGGYHKNYSTEPDICVFGKAISNGFAMAAIVGTKEFLDGNQKSFISSTYWTERIGPAAALATINEMKRLKANEQICQISRELMTNALIFKNAVMQKGLPFNFSFSKEPAILNFDIDSSNPKLLRSLITKLMLDRGYLASNRLYPTIHHNSKIYSKYFHLMLEALVAANEHDVDKWVKVFGIKPISSDY